MNPSTETPPPLTKSDDKLWIVLSHLSLFLGVGIILPLIVFLVKKDESKMVRHHAKEALNFHISIYIYAVLCIPLFMIVVGVPLLLLLGVGSSILAIVAAVRGAERQEYRYPLTIRFIS